MSGIICKNCNQEIPIGVVSCVCGGKRQGPPRCKETSCDAYDLPDPICCQFCRKKESLVIEDDSTTKPVICKKCGDTTNVPVRSLLTLCKCGGCGYPLAKECDHCHEILEIDAKLCDCGYVFEGPQTGLTIKMCPHCGSKDEYTEKDTKCTNCLRPLNDTNSDIEKTVKCPECNAHNLYNVTTCHHCKKPLGRKFDEGKPEWSLFPFEAGACIVKVMMFGAKKYARDNWKHVKPPMRYIDACYRHLGAWSDGEKNDKETGFSHLWHAGCCIIFAIWLELKGKLTNETRDN